MKVKRIMANTATSDLKKAAAFYRDILGLDLVMDHGWFQTYGSDAKMTFQVSFGTEGGSGTPVPDLSIEVDDLEVALARFKKANVPIEYGPVSETWGVRRFFVRDPFGKLINILQHEMNRGAPLIRRCSERGPGRVGSSGGSFHWRRRELARSAK